MSSSLTPAEIQYYKAHANDTRQPNMIATAVCGLIIAYVAVFLRFIARKRSAAGFGIDDWLIVAAVVGQTLRPVDHVCEASINDLSADMKQFPLTGYSICAFLAVSFGEGKHILFLKSPRSFIEVGLPSIRQSSSIPHPTLISFHVKGYVATITSYSICIVLTKSSILCMYNRIFPSRGLLRTSWTIGVIVVAYNIPLVLVTALDCIPLSSLWTGEPGTCIHTLQAFTTLA